MIDPSIAVRRTIKPENMNGRAITGEMILHLLQLADWAPTHARTEPWRFIVYGPDTIARFGREHADIYRNNTPAEAFKEGVYDKLLHAGDGASHVIISYMKRGSNPNIPEIEEIAATGAAIQNLLIGATANGIASFWSSGGRTHHPAFGAHFGLNEADKVLGLIYLGYTDGPAKEGKRIVPLSEKIQWM